MPPMYIASFSEGLAGGGEQNRLGFIEYELETDIEDAKRVLADHMRRGLKNVIYHGSSFDDLATVVSEFMPDQTIEEVKSRIRQELDDSPPTP